MDHFPSGIKQEHKKKTPVFILTVHFLYKEPEWKYVGFKFLFLYFLKRFFQLLQRRQKKDLNTEQKQSTVVPQTIFLTWEDCIKPSNIWKNWFIWFLELGF